LREDPYTPRYMIASDIKDFKLINQFFGEKFGDEILKKVAVYLRKLSHRGNVYGRISGDKFALLMPCKYFSEEIFIRVLKSMQSLTDEGLYKMHIYAGVYPVSASGTPWTAAYIGVKGDTIADLTEDMGAEQKARVTYDNILRLSDDPDVNDVIRFLREREVVHFQRFGEALRRTTEKLNEKNVYAINPSFDK